MENFSAPFSAKTTSSGFSYSSSSNVGLEAQQNIGHPENVIFPNYDATFSFSGSNLVPYDQNIQFPYTNIISQVNHPVSYPVCSLPMGQSNVHFGVPIKEQGWPQARKEDGKLTEAWMGKVAREKRIHVRQQTRKSVVGATSASERKIRGQPNVTNARPNVKVTIDENINRYAFCTPDGKRLEEIMTKKLKNSDVSNLGRIVLPKREAERKLPTLRDKEKITLVFKDVYSGLQWIMKYKYWSNNKSRMYVLEDAGDFVKYYELQRGDSITLYVDEFQNLYVSAKKEKNIEVSEPSSNMERLQTRDIGNYNYMYAHQAEDIEEENSLGALVKELNHEKEAEEANNLLTLSTGGGSSSATKYDKMQVFNQETRDELILMNHNQQNNLEEVYAGLDNIFEPGSNYFHFGPSGGLS
ncbi:hypothetical protein RJT34_04428 [Clitoria ternatea]|uniref:TF-B3 domain-containing protein n=1 Tax=Clitoria ternatea TaxID=43366 RepID=A0AAN9KP67_CLITE